MATNQEMLTWTYQKVTEMLPLVKGFWATPIKRGESSVSALQELADCKTLALENRELLNKIIAKQNEGA